MKNVRVVVALAIGIGCAVLSALAVAGGAGAARATPYLWQNCTHVHTKYRHGVGKRYAHDHTRSGTNPVTNFYRSTPLYNAAMQNNSDLDRDRDGIACENNRVPRDLNPVPR